MVVKSSLSSSIASSSKGSLRSSSIASSSRGSLRSSSIASSSRGSLSSRSSSGLRSISSVSSSSRSSSGLRSISSVSSSSSLTMPCAASASNSLMLKKKQMKNASKSPKAVICHRSFPPGGDIYNAKVIPESCQRTEGIIAWQMDKEEEALIEQEKAEKLAEKQRKSDERKTEREARNAKLREKRKKLSEKDSDKKEDNQETLHEEDQNKAATRSESKHNIQENELDHRRSSRSPSVSSKGTVISDTSSCKVKAGQRANIRGGAKGPPGRTAVKCVKKIKGKKGRPDRYELLVTIDLELWKLNDEQVAEFKEVFMLFDKDEDGVLSFSELSIVMKSLGQRPSEKRLLSMVRAVSEDQLYDTIEFNEFLQMMSKQQKEDVTIDSLLDAFRIFDKDEDGFITVEELTRIMTSLGERMTHKELNEMIKEADSDGDGLINYQEFCGVLCVDNSKANGSNKKTEKEKRKSRPERINEDNKENDNSISENNNNNNNNESLKTG